MFRFVPLFLLLPAVAAGQSKETITYLKKLQTKDGGFRIHAKAKDASLRATSTALRALRYFGGTTPNKDDCAKFVLSCRDKKTGGFADTPGGKVDPILTSVGLMALTELKALKPDVEKAAIEYMAKNARKFEEIRMAAAGLETVGKKSSKNADWLTALAKMANKDGTFGASTGQARDTGGAGAAVLRLGGKLKDKKAVLKVLHAGQRSDGGYGKEEKKTSDLETTYRVVRCLHMLESKPPKVAPCRAFIAKCRNKDGGYGVAPGGPSSTAGTYFASIILHWLNEK